MDSEKIKGTQSFARSMNVLQLIADQYEAPGVTEILRLSGLTRPTLYRILASLEAEGVIVKTSDKRYQLGARLVALAHTALAQVNVRQIAQDALTALRDETGETVHLAVRNLNEMVYVDKIESREVVRMASTIGTRVPFHSSSVGKAYLAALPKSDAEHIMDHLDYPLRTEHTSTDIQDLKDKIEIARQRGYSFDDQENEDGIICFGAPILDLSGQPVASVSISVPMFRLKADKSHYWQPLIQRCSQISADLGFK
ncbi:MAG: IclR family transcriptional regulator [Motiliproteus sp.]